MIKMKNFWNEFAKKVAVISAFFTLVVLTLMLADFLRSYTALANAEPALDAMRLQITQTPENEILKKEFASLELVYRRAYFVDKAQAQTGSVLIFLGLAVFLSSLALYSQTAQKKLEIPDKDSLKSKNLTAKKFRRILLGAVLLLVLALFVNLMLPKKSLPKILEASYASLEELDANWTSLRGSRNDGIARSFALDKDAKLELEWKTEIPLQAYNSPLLFGDKIFFSGADDSVRSTFCYSALDGKMLWRADLKTPAKSNYDEQSGPAPSTMSTDGRRAYAIFPTGELLCTDYEGKILYVKNFGMPEILYSYASSLLVCGKELVVQMYLEKTKVLYVLDSATGQEIWKYEGATDASWSTPTLALDGERRVLCVSSCGGIEAFDLSDGAKLWSLPCFGGEVATSLSYGDGKIFGASDGSVALAVDLKEGKILWQNDALILPSVASCLYVNEELYLFSSGGTVSRVNAKNGELIKEYDCDDGFYASAINLGGLIIAQNNAGAMFAIKPNSDIDLTKPIYKFDEASYASIAASSSKIIVRVGAYLYSFKILNSESGK